MGSGSGGGAGSGAAGTGSSAGASGGEGGFNAGDDAGVLPDAGEAVMGEAVLQVVGEDGGDGLQ